MTKYCKIGRPAREFLAIGDFASLAGISRDFRVENPSNRFPIFSVSANLYSDGADTLAGGQGRQSHAFPLFSQPEIPIGDIGMSKFRRARLPSHTREGGAW